mgnify:CR=1 FL=1
MDDFIVSARKYRPQHFNTVVGQSHITNTLKQAIKNGKIAQAYLFCGPRGVGKTTCARIFAKTINCTNLTPDGEACDACESCLSFNSGASLNVYELDAASNNSVEDIRNLVDQVRFAPQLGDYKVYVIDEVHMLSNAAFNAFLKTLEEPPKHAKFILATTDVQKVPITILSRCLQLKLRNLSAAEIEQHLRYVLEEEQVNSDNTALELLAQAANGSMRDALSLTDQAIAFSNANITEIITRQMLGISDNSSIIEILSAIQKSDSISLVNICQRLNSEGANLENILEQINYSLFNIGLAQLSPQPQLSNELQNLAKSISLQDCQLYFEISNLGLEQIRKVQNQYPIFVMSLLRMIAFTIGSTQEKQLLIQTKNCTTELVASAPTETVTTQAKEEIHPQQQTPTIITEVTEEATIVKATPISEVVIEKKPAQQSEEIAPWEEANLEQQSNEAPIVAATPAISAQFSNWLEFVKTIDLTKIDKTIAVVLSNCSQIGSSNPDELTLAINDSYRQLVTTACVDQIEQMLFNQYQHHFDLNFNFVAEIQDGTLKSHQQAESQAQQLSAEEAIHNDPVIQDLVTNFAAKIVPNSIKPL